MVSTQLADVSTTVNANATSYTNNRHCFRNPRGNKRFYTFYSKDVGSGNTIVYAWSEDGYIWTGQTDLTALTSTDLIHSAVVFVEDSGGSQTIVYLAARVESTKAVRIRRGVIADAGDTISWDTEEELFSSIYGNITLGIDNNAYLWAGRDTGSLQSTSYEVKCSTGTRPSSPISWSAVTVIGSGPGYGGWGVGCTPYGNGMVFIGIINRTVNSYYPWACYSQQGNPPTDEGEDDGGWGSGRAVAGTCVTDADNIVHLVYGRHWWGMQLMENHTWDPSTKTWSGIYTIYGGQDDTQYPPSVLIDTNTTPNTLYAVYEHGTGEVEYKTTPANAISWGAATTIENHAEEGRNPTFPYNSDPVISGNIFGAFVTGTNLALRSFIHGEGIAGEGTIRVKEKGFRKINRGSETFLDGDTFTARDESRWNFTPTNFSGFVWDGGGEVTIPAEGEMTSIESYAYAMLTAIVQSADLSDCKIGFYADENHFAWIDQDSLRVRNGKTAEIPVDMSNTLPNNVRIKIVLIWTPVEVRVIVTRLDTNTREVFVNYNPPHLEAPATFQVITSGSSLLVEDYGVFDTENELMTALGILPYDSSMNTIPISSPALDTLGPYSTFKGFDKTLGSATAQAIHSNLTTKTITVQSAHRNTKSIWLGGSVSGTQRWGVELLPGDNIPITVPNASMVYGIAEGSNQILHCVYTV